MLFSRDLVAQIIEETGLRGSATFHLWSKFTHFFPRPVIIIIFVIVFIPVPRPFLTLLIAKHTPIPLLHPSQCFSCHPLIAHQFCEAMGPVPVNPESIFDFLGLGR
jgi:hypothetical protein